MIQQILKDEAFEEAALEVVSEKAGNPARGESGADNGESQVTDLGYREGRRDGHGISSDDEGTMLDESGGSLDDVGSRRSKEAGVLLKEASTSDFPDLVGKTSNVEAELIKAYEIAPSSWRRLVTTVPLRDMKTIIRLRRSDTDKYLAVPEGAECDQGSFSTYKVSYAPKKYERGVNFTWEMLVNDDFGAFGNIGRDLGLAAQTTISDFVIGFIRDNRTIYDGKGLFHADHENLGSAALSESALSAAVTAMRQQTSEKGNPLAIVPGFLLVPPELEFTAKKLVNSTYVPGGSLNDINMLKGIVQVIVEPLLTDANNWYVVAKPSSIATIEVGFLGGRETPEIMVKEDYDRDLIWYKGRLVFGGAVMDYRGFYGSIVS
jgi:hypothetical protein